jgi:hypothetical protein
MTLGLAALLLPASLFAAPGKGTAHAKTVHGMKKTGSAKKAMTKYASVMKTHSGKKALAKPPTGKASAKTTAKSKPPANDECCTDSGH